MDQLIEFFKTIMTPEKVINWGGLTALIAIVFAETGLLIGFFLPGDSLLLTAGLLVSQDIFKVNILTLNISLILAAIIGDTVGYWFGRKTGPKIFAKEDSRFFKKKYLLKAQEFYERHGGKAIIYARFVPFARTFAPILAGVGNMNYTKFVTYNIVGGIVWVVSMTLLGYFFGKIPIVKDNFEKVVILVIILSVMPIVIGYFKERKRNKLEGK
ncbi:MAG: VTT domain-containing protein [Bacteroidetes bacterium]|nr:VTT domain-containing protein [Bacteroidota bacterium]MBX7045462.1 VTT domain-containing protein [Ignavibacteria bacterium]